MRTLLLILLAPLTCLAQDNYRLKFQVEGWRDTTVYLAYYWSDVTYVKDTAEVDERGNFQFDGNGRLPQGVYLLVVNKKKIFDFVVGERQDFTIKTSSEDYLFRLTSDDLDNQLFFENMTRAIERHNLANAADGEDIENKGNLARVEKEIKHFQEQLVKKHASTVTARILLAHKPLEIPANAPRADGTLDSTFHLLWYRAHYFDNFKLADDALIRAPGKIYMQKVNDYLDRLFVQHPDSLEAPLERILGMAKANPETFKFLAWQLMVKYREHSIMGLDEVYVDLFDKYFASGLMDFWVTKPMLKNIKDEADRMRRSLVGRTGSNLIMLDAEFTPRSMYDIRNKYTILFIFDPDCGSCKKETPKLVNFYEKKKFDLEVYAVSLDSSMSKMRDMITKMRLQWITVNGPRTYVGPVQELYDADRTPAIYVLDRQKKIIAKKIVVSQLEEFFAKYEAVEKLKDPSRR